MHRLLFSCVSKCRLWFDRLLDCKRKAHKDIKSLFAFIYRAYRKDEKLSKPWESNNEIQSSKELEESGDVCEAGGGGGLVSLKSVYT